VLHFSAVLVKVKDNRGSFVSDLAVWGSEVVVDGAELGQRQRVRHWNCVAPSRVDRTAIRKSRVGGGRRSREILGWAMGRSTVCVMVA
jgi:hypothetical protein